MSKNIKRLLLSLFLWVFTLLIIRLAANNPVMVENYYSQRIYPFISGVLTSIFSIIPFASGELILTGIIVFIIYLIFRFFKKPTKRLLLSGITKTLLVISMINLVFWIFWGLNNYRMPLEEQLGYYISPLAIDDLESTALFLLYRIDEIETQLTFDDNHLPVFEGQASEMLTLAQEGFREFAKEHPFLAQGYYSRPKSMLFSEVMNHLNYSGIYNPFTAEANVNMNIPSYKIPFVAMHEIAHQRGIAGEGEANYLAFLALIQHDNLYFQYSGYTSGLIYVMNALHRADRQRFIEVRKGYSTYLEALMEDNRQHWLRYNTIVSEIGEKNNDLFLRNTGQVEGTKSYGLVVDFIAAYVKQYDLDTVH